MADVEIRKIVTAIERSREICRSAASWLLYVRSALVSWGVPGEMRVYGIFAVTPVVNRYAVEQSPLHYGGGVQCQRQDSVRRALRDTGAPGRSSQSPCIRFPA